MELTQARIQYVEITKRLVSKTKQLEKIGAFDDVVELAGLTDQLFDALETINNVGQVPDAEYLEVEEL